MRLHLSPEQVDLVFYALSEYEARNSCFAPIQAHEDDKEHMLENAEKANIIMDYLEKRMTIEGHMA